MTQSLKKRAPELQAMVNDAVASSGAIGAQVSVISGDERIDLCAGLANLELNSPMTADTISQVGSVTKVFNASLVMTLVEENKLDLDTPVIQYVPNLRLPDTEALNTLTLRHLLSMSSGLDQGPYHEHGRGEDALARFVDAMGDIPQLFPPGQGFGYSNAGTNIAGYVAERVTGVGWDALIRRRILDPAGLAHSTTLAEELPFYRVSVGHSRAQNGQPAKVVRPWYITRSQGPSGSTLTMNAHNLASFGQIFINNGKAADGRRVLAESSVKTMMTPHTDVPVGASLVCIGEKWGLGPSMDRWGNTVVWGHAGGNRSGSSRFSWLPDKRGVLSTVVNTVDADEGFTTRILQDVSRAVFGVGPSLPAAVEPVVRLENPERFIGQFERYGTRHEITEEAGRLRFRQFSLGSGKVAEALGLIYDTALTPLGGDRFLMETPGSGTLPVPIQQCVLGFYGADAQGRATNMATPFLASRRTR